MRGSRRFLFRGITVALLAATFIWVQPSFAVLSYPGCPALSATDFKEVVLVARGAQPAGDPAPLVTDATMLEPVSLYVYSNGNVYWTERSNTGNTAGQNLGVGRLRRYDPVANTVKTLASFNISSGVSSGQIGNTELGLRFITFDPNYTVNHWVYIYYMPRTTVTGRGVDTMLVSRFNMPNLDSIDMTSEKKLLKMPWTPGICCHQGGAMDWDSSGNLYITTGNNTENSDTWAPMVSTQLGTTGDPKDRATQDNQARTANTMDWRGKVLRIRPDSSARGYSIPPGNLRQMLYTVGGAWVAGQDTTKILPEIYSFGHRNMYSLYVDKPTGWLVVGEVGPDATTTSTTRGAAGRDEWNLITHPDFEGFPYFIGANAGYNMWDPATSAYDLPIQNPDSVFNNSPNNTGITHLPPAVPCILAESKQVSLNTAFNFGPGTGTAATTGPIYHYNPALNSTKKFPPQFDGKWFITESVKNWVAVATVNGTGTQVTAVDTVPGSSTVYRASGGYGIITMQMGPEGALYLTHYDAANFSSTNNTRISRIEYTGTCLPATPILGQRNAMAPMGHPLYVGLGEGRLFWPSSMNTVEVFNLEGRKVWTGERASSEASSELPTNLRSGLFQVRFKP